MNRNAESHFSLLPHASVQRSIFDRSSSHKTSFNAGRLIPFYVDEVLPGDTFDITTSKVIRAQTLLAPIMDDLYLDTYWFFVPNRLVWEHWEEFCGENRKGPWAQTVEYKIPKLLSPRGLDASGKDDCYPFNPGTLADYMGVPVASEIATVKTYLRQPRWDSNTASGPLSKLVPSALPFRGYALICNHFFRDENLTSPLLVPLDDANQTGSNDDYDNLAAVACGGMPYKVAKYHDYFTSCLPAPQKGKEVSMPVSFTSPVMPVIPQNTIQLPHTTTWRAANRASFSGASYPIMFEQSTESKTWPWTAPLGWATDSGTRGSPDHKEEEVGFDGISFNKDTGGDVVSRPVTWTSSSLKDSGNPLIPLNLAADASSLGGSFSINNFRLAVAMQSFLEALARGGSRYGEMIATIFGVQNPDARLQHPEYLGGNRIPLNVSQVSNTAQTVEDPLGDVGAQSATSDVHSDFVKSFTEHGYLFGLCCVRYRHSYPQGLEKFWSRETFTDYYNPKFANLGEVPVYQNEIWNPSSYFDSKSYPDEKVPVFGYQEIWADYRYKPDRASGEMRPNFKQTLAYWHLADNYSKAPTLSDDWIREDPSIVDRVLAVSSVTSNQFWADFYVQCKCTRAMPMYSIPALEPRF